MNREYGLGSVIPLIAAALLGGCASTSEAPTSATVSEEVTAKASVVAVDKTSRVLTLKLPEGGEMEMVAGPEVRNFDQIMVGNQVTARYRVTLSARLLATDESDTESAVEVSVGRAAAGEKPAGELGASVSTTESPPARGRRTSAPVGWCRSSARTGAPWPSGAASPVSWWRCWCSTASARRCGRSSAPWRSGSG